MFKCRTKSMCALAVVFMVGCSSSGSDADGCNIPEHDHKNDSVTLASMGLYYDVSSGPSGYKNLAERDATTQTYYYSPSFYFVEDYFLNPKTRDTSISGHNNANASGGSSNRLGSNGGSKSAQESERALIANSEPYRIVPFDFDKYKINRNGKVTITQIKDFMSNNPGLKLVINGRADVVGTSQYNINLSQKRAISVRNELISKGLNPSRVVALWSGEKGSSKGPSFTIAEVYINGNPQEK